MSEHWAEDVPLADAFRRFDQANPRVYAELVKLVRDWQHGNPGMKMGMKMLWEVLRWNLSLATASTDPFKLNNNHTSFYARKLMTHAGAEMEIRGRSERCECAECEAERKAQREGRLW